MKEISFWVEGGSNIGLGHFYRCIALSDIFLSNNYKVTFYLNKEFPEDHLIQFKSKIEFFFHDQLDFNEKEAKKLVIDIKEQNYLLLDKIKKTTIKTILIDNTSELGKFVDLVIIPSLMVNENEVNNLNDNVFFGSKYLIIHDKFLSQIGKVDRQFPKTSFKILVSMGGSDLNDLTKFILDSILLFQNKSEITVNVDIIIGPNFKLGRMYYESEYKFENFTFHDKITNLAPFILKNDIGISALGVSIYEFASLSLPSIIIPNYENDLNYLKILKKYEIALPLDYHKRITKNDLTKSLLFLSREENWKRYVENCKKIIDGKGKQRIFDLIDSL